MKKIFKIFMLLSLLSLFLLPFVNAFSINMNLEDTTPTDTTNIVEGTQTEDNLSENESLITDVDNAGETDDSSPRVTTTKSTDEDEFLTIENVLSIIIIAIGLLLIFLAIAILIRFK